MKKQRLYTIYFFLLMLVIAYSSAVFCQNIPAPPTPTCASCGGKNGVHAPTCPYYNPPGSAQKSKTPSTAVPSQIQQLNSLIDLFNSPVNNKEVEAQKEAARKLALEKKLHEDSLKKARHENEMKTFKSLDGNTNVVHLDAGTGSGLTLKPLPSVSAPMTQEERERQNIIQKGSNVTWNYNDFADVSPDNRISGTTPERELTDNEKLINDMIARVEENGGRLAAITGRFILNIKDGVMDYMDDATNAVISGNTYLMQETGEFDVRKITTNALYKTTTQTATAYYENAKESVMGGLKEKSIGVVKGTAINTLKEYEYFDNLSKSWQQIN